jgi:hypothetical protein
MKILELIQGSDEWLEARKGVATASNFSQIITPSSGKESASIGKFAKKLALEICYEKLTENNFKSAAMQAGNELEPIARSLYQKKTLELVEEAGFMISDCGCFGYSPDGLVGDDGLIEIKSVEAEKHSEIILDGKAPLDYKCQIQGGLWISERKWCDLVVYNHYCKNEDKKLLIFRVDRDEEFIKNLEICAKKVILLRDEVLRNINN